MREFNFVNPNGVDKGPRIVPARNILEGTQSYVGESVITEIPEIFTGGRIEGTDVSFNGTLVWKSRIGRNTGNPS